MYARFRIVLLNAMISVCVISPAQSPIRSRKELLRDPSDAGIGLSLPRYRDYKPAADLQKRRDHFAELGLIHPGFAGRGFASQGLGAFYLDLNRLLLDPWFVSGYRPVPWCPPPLYRPAWDGDFQNRPPVGLWQP
ncbi:hypothetical protein Poly59_41500 [Rubripirellula reticaptiva]|uniref:Uncharacterized protein n=2 Tax=Rubripirellula reticaptiva TaxID=2528013 RepID=A0A5C6EIG1_9BACT|nr:hypothetical protein Poly59_41500 [Rubripirellula reticaptiva]